MIKNCRQIWIIPSIFNIPSIHNYSTKLLLRVFPQSISNRSIHSSRSNNQLTIREIYNNNTKRINGILENIQNHKIHEKNNEENENMAAAMLIPYNMLIQELFHNDNIKEESLSRLLKTQLKGDDMNFSIFVNKLLINAFNRNSSNISRGTFKRQSELIFIVFQFYCKQIDKFRKEKALSIIELSDLNKICGWFIRVGQLGKARKVLFYVVSKYDFELSKIPILNITKRYLQIFCGGLPQYWTVNESVINKRLNRFGKRYETKKLCEKSDYFKLSSAYKIIDKKTTGIIFDNLFVNKKSIKNDNSLLLHEKIVPTLIYSLIVQKDFTRINLFLNEFFENFDKKIVSTSNIDFENILIAIITAKWYQNGELTGCFEIITHIIENKSKQQIYLSPIFWTKIIHLGIKLQNKDDVYCCFELMKKYYTTGQTLIPYESNLLNHLFKLFYISKDYKNCKFILDYCYKKTLFKSKKTQITKKDLIILRKYQKFLLKMYINSYPSNETKSNNFIKKYSISENDENELIMIQKELVNKRNEKVDAKIKEEKKDQIKKYDRMEEEDMLLGRFW